MISVNKYIIYNRNNILHTMLLSNQDKSSLISLKFNTEWPKLKITIGRSEFHCTCVSCFVIFNKTSFRIYFFLKRDCFTNQKFNTCYLNENYNNNSVTGILLCLTSYCIQWTDERVRVCSERFCFCDNLLSKNPSYEPCWFP